MKMVLLLVRLSVIVILGIVQVSASVTCPWHCSCLLHEQLITVNCSGLSLVNFPTDVDTRVSTRSSICYNGIDTVPLIETSSAKLSPSSKANIRLAG
jgi:hypothetical protein